MNASHRSMTPAQQMLHYNACLRLYVAVTPIHGELGWQQTNQFTHLTQEQRQPGHWYRQAGSNSLIEFKLDGSGQWHKDGILPPGVDPASVVTVPDAAPVPTLLEQMLAILDGLPKNAPNHADITGMIAYLKDLPTPDRAARLVKSLQTTLASAPPGTPPNLAEHQLRFLAQASAQLVGTELLAGKACGQDVAGVLILTAIAQAIAATDSTTAAAVLTKAAARPVTATAELAAHTIEDCWYRGLKDQIATGLDSLRKQGDSIVREAQQGAYPEGHPELALDFYYAALLQAVPYLLAANEGYLKLSNGPALSPEDAEAFAHKAETAEEKLVRMTSALVYGLQDVDLDQLHSRQDFVAALLKSDPDKAASFVFDTINLKFFYPLPFKSVFLGPDPPPTAP